MNQAQSLERASVWTEQLVLVWWQRMAGIFGRVWVDQFGAAPPQDWQAEMAGWSLPLAGAVLVHYRRAGLKFPPNLSEVGRVARDLRASIEPPPKRKEHPANAVSHAFATQYRKDLKAVEQYRLEHRRASTPEACIALMKKRGIVRLVPESILAKARAAETESLQREATAAAAKRKDRDIEDALEEQAEREAIMAESGSRRRKKFNERRRNGDYSRSGELHGA